MNGNMSNTQIRMKIPRFRGQKKKCFEALMDLREQVFGQMKFHSDEALDSSKNSNGELTSMSTHMADAGSDNFLHDMELGMMSAEGNVLEQIDEAIQRLISGEYGSCMDCGVDIGEARLDAKPYAQYCIKCKSCREKNGGFNPEYSD